MTKYRIKKDEIVKRLLAGAHIRKTVSSHCNYITEYYFGSDKLHGNSVLAALKELNGGIKVPISFSISNHHYDSYIRYSNTHKSLLSGKY